LLRRFRRRAPPRKDACELPNHRTSLPLFNRSARV
jgi:hypothetical protein